MYQYNYALFNNLPTIVGFNLNYLSRIIHVPVATIFFYRQKKDIPLLTLLRICNELHISISHFIIPTTNPVSNDKSLDNPPIILGPRQDYVQDPFTPIEFHHLDLGTALTLSSLRTIDDTCKFLNISYKTFVRYFRSQEPPTALSVKEYLRICHLANIYPGDHLIDFNKKIAVYGSMPKEITMQERIASKDKQIIELSTNNQSLSTINQRLHAQIKNLQEQNARLTAKLSELENYKPLIAAEEGGKYV